MQKLKIAFVFPQKITWTFINKSQHFISNLELSVRFGT